MNVDSNNDIHPQHILIFDRGDYTSCTLNLHGATVTSWRINNKEMIFVSRESHFTGLSHIRGGIQFAFPVTGLWNFGPRHGFARDLAWTVEVGPEKIESGDIYAIVSLSDDAYTNSVWGYKFKLYYKITLHEKKLVFAIGVENYSQTSPFDFNIMQHSLMKVPDVTKCEITGLHKCKYQDCMKDNKIFIENRENVTINEQTDRIYISSPNEVCVKNFGHGGMLRIQKKRMKDITLWNPWIEQSQQIVDLGDDEYKNFIAIEAGLRSKALRLEPVCCWQAFETYEFVEEKEENTVEDFYSLFDGYC